MNKKQLLISLASALTVSAGAQTANTYVSDLAVKRADQSVVVSFNIDPSNYSVPTNKAVVLTPAIVNATDTLRMTPVTVAGRNNWYYHTRNNEAGAMLLRSGKKEPSAYRSQVPYKAWMEVSDVVIFCDTVSECGCDRRSAVYPVAAMDFSPAVFTQDASMFEYIEPNDTVAKVFNLSGRANIVFKVGRTDIDWTYKANQAELDTILSTINAVKNNPDATVEQILLTGYASPEGSYAGNERLAKGRTEVVKKYVAEHATFPASVYKTSFVAEDWAGLREWLTTSPLNDKDAIIALIDDKAIAVDKKNDALRKRFPDTYKFLLANVYPMLRHTDYVITYKIRSYYDVKEIAAVMVSNPRNLSLNEFFLLANSLPKGSPEYDNVFFTAARMFPTSDVANTNAAYSAINQGDLRSAREFLGQVQTSAATDYAWGIIHAKEGNFTEALGMLQKARSGGITEAGVVIDQIKKITDPSREIRMK
ncbi:MAG: OmpA family protein [Bacteroidales bacterium]|nr:OmpA family protein [Bacteroidales bacterium]